MNVILLIFLILGIILLFGCFASFIWFCADELTIRDYPVGFNSIAWKEYKNYIFTGMILGLLLILTFYGFKNE